MYGMIFSELNTDLPQEAVPCCQTALSVVLGQFDRENCGWISKIEWLGKARALAQWVDRRSANRWQLRPSSLLRSFAQPRRSQAVRSSLSVHLLLQAKYGSPRVYEPSTDPGTNNKHSRTSERSSIYEHFKCFVDWEGASSITLIDAYHFRLSVHDGL